MPKLLKDINSGENMYLLTLAVCISPPIMLVLLIAEFFYLADWLLWLVLPDLVLTALLVFAARWFLDHIGSSAAAILMPSGKGTPAPREYSEQTAMIIRGRYAEAAKSYRAILEHEPANIDVQLRLGRLLEHECNSPVEAEVWYRRVRDMSPPPDQDWAVSQALIDLYERTGQRGKLKLELMRLARHYANTSIETNARRRFAELRSAEAADAAGNSDGSLKGD